MLKALEHFNPRTASGVPRTAPFAVEVVTGKGPEKNPKYVERMRKVHMSLVAVCTAYLESEDYPILLGSTDLSVCLQTPISGKLCCDSHALVFFGCVLYGVWRASYAMENNRGLQQDEEKFSHRIQAAAKAVTSFLTLSASKPPPSPFCPLLPQISVSLEAHRVG